MKTVSLQEAQSDLSRLVEAAAKGDEFVIARDGRALVRVVRAEDGPVAGADAAKPPAKTRRIGFLKDRISVPDDFDRANAKEIEEMFYGKPE